MLRTRCTDMFGLAHPVMSAPMALHSVLYGQSAGFVSAVRPAADVVHTVSEEAEAVLRSRPPALLADR